MTSTEQKLIGTLGVDLDIRSIDIGGHKINYAVGGTGKPLVLVHGGTFGWGTWYANIADFAKHFTVYAVDLPGGGNSSKIDYKDFPGNFENFLPAFIRANNIIKPDIIGHSFGGWIAFKAALENPGNIGKLILVDSTGFSKHPTTSDIIMSFYPLASFLSKTVLRPDRNNAVLEKFLRGAFYCKDTELSPEFIDYFYETMTRHHNLRFISRLITFRKNFYLDSLLGGASCPTMIIWGENDPIMPLKSNQSNFKGIKNSKVEIIADSGHVPFQEKPGQFNQLAINFLN